MPLVLLGALAPVPLFYLIYFRHFSDYYRRNGLTPQYLKQAESLLFGILLALLVYILAPVLDRSMPWDGRLAESFLKAALVEKAGALLFIGLILRRYPSFSILEGVIAGVLVGTGFALVENLLYVLKFGEHLLVARTLFSTPLHITTCGLIGYFLGQYSYYAQAPYRAWSLVKALAAPFVLHGAFDALLMTGGNAAYAVGPMIFAMVALLEVTLATAKLVPALDEFRRRRWDFEEWRIILRQPRYERWIRRSMGTPGAEIIPLLKGRYGIFKTVGIVLLACAALAGAALGAEIARLAGLRLNPDETLLLMSVFPASAAATLIIVGAVNPSFLKNSLIRIPIIFDAVLLGGGVEETVVTFDITPTHCFLRTADRLGSDAPLRVLFECRDIRSPEINAEVTWENHREKGLPSGTIVRFARPPRAFYAFLARYILFRVTRGIAFNLRLPGFQLIRRLFMRPSTVMQREVACRAGAVLFREGDAGNSFYFIRKGRVELYRTLGTGERVLVDSVEAGQVFNEMAILGDRSRTVSAVCTEDSVLAAADMESLEALIRNSPDFAVALIRKLALRIDHSQKALIENLEGVKEAREADVRSRRAALVLLLQGLGFLPRDGVITVPLDPGPQPAADEMLTYLENSLLHGDTAPSPGMKELEDALRRVDVRFTTKGGGRPRES
jgi:CRP-like cAMP-binding protein/RsiW-degrading membrane proteinase PrsW (M82 family)